MPVCDVLVRFLNFFGDKREALRLDEKQHGGIKQVERLAKLRNPGNLKLQTPNRKLQFAVSHEKPDTKGRRTAPL